MKIKLNQGLIGVLVLLFLPILNGCEWSSITEESVNTEIEKTVKNEEVTLVPYSSSHSEANFQKNQRRQYSCFISTLVNEEKEYNYWNQRFIINFPQKAIKEAEGAEKYQAFIFSDEHASPRAGSLREHKNVVRVAHCTLPNSKLATRLLEKRLKRFGIGTWMENNQPDLGIEESPGYYTCTKEIITEVCLIDSQGNLYDCMITERRCVEYTWVETNDGTSGGGPGSPSDDPLPCDPTGTEPCYDDGSGSIQPPEPDPCDEDNPPAYCSDPCGTGNSLIDNLGTQLAFEQIWEDSNFGTLSNPKPEKDRVEQGGYLVPNPSDESEYVFQRLGSSFIVDPGPCNIGFKYPKNMPEGTIFVHTHPYKENELQNECIPGKVLKYKGKNIPHKKDKIAISKMGVEKGIIIDATNIHIFDSSGKLDEFERCGY